jgi:hypothetical protein
MSNSSTQVSEAVGAYTTFSCDISKEAKDVFTKVFKDHVGVNYTPVAVATQVVAGTNYAFFCNAKGVYPNAINQAALVNIHQPLPGQGEPNITGIRVFNIGNLS